MPDWRARIIDRLAAHDLDPMADASLIDELVQHLDDRYREARAGGASKADAIDAALRELDGDEKLAAELARRRPQPAPLPIGAPARGRWWRGHATAIASLLAVVFLASLIPARTASRAIRWMC